MNATLAGIPQHGNVLGNPNAPITITEYGDLVCPTCADFAVTTEPQIIAALVKTGKAKLVYRAFETASAYANGSQFVNTQVAARSAGLQDKEWNYLLLDLPGAAADDQRPACRGRRLRQHRLPAEPRRADQGPQPHPVAGAHDRHSR